MLQVLETLTRSLCLGRLHHFVSEDCIIYARAILAMIHFQVTPMNLDLRNIDRHSTRQDLNGRKSRYDRIIIIFIIIIIIIIIISIIIIIIIITSTTIIVP